MTRLDRINAMAQQARAQTGELGSHQVELPDRPYGLRAGDEVIFTGQLWLSGQERVENGTPAEVMRADPQHGRVLLRTREPERRDIEIDPREFSDLRLAYAQHVYKAQGLTTDRALVLAGGWQTDRERAYVAMSRARDRTDLYIARVDLGEEGMDADAMERLAERMSDSRAKQASIRHAEALVPEWIESEVGRALRESHERERAAGIDNDIQ